VSSSFFIVCGRTFPRRPFSWDRFFDLALEVIRTEGLDDDLRSEDADEVLAVEAFGR
jgi:hypothetical protein